MATNVYTCPNDGELLVIEVASFGKTATPQTEYLRCPYCRYVIDSPTAKTTLKSVTSETYKPPSKVAAAPQAANTNKSTKG